MIYFFSEEIEFPDFNQELFSKWLFSVAKTEEVELENLNYIFCSDDYLLEMNKKHLNHDYYTDIITFPLSENPIAADMFISLDRISDNAISLENSFENEFKRVLVHGLLHMIGYNDKDDSSKQIMRAKEDHYLNLFPTE